MRRSPGANDDNRIYINGKLFDKADAKISVYDHGLLYGDGVFEGIRIYRRQGLQPQGARRPPLRIGPLHRARNPDEPGRDDRRPSTTPCRSTTRRTATSA